MTARSGSEEATRGCGPTRVLIVDDHALLADGLCIELAAAGFETDAIRGPTPEAILERARAWEPHVVLLDLHLGETVGSGLAFVGTLSELGAAVVVLTGTTDALLLAACVEAGAVGIVSKTESLAGLSETVARAARAERLIPLTRREELLEELRELRHTERSREELFRRMTPRECEVLAGLMRGATAAEIAARLVRVAGNRADADSRDPPEARRRHAARRGGDRVPRRMDVRADRGHGRGRGRGVTIVAGAVSRLTTAPPRSTAAKRAR